jgi:hypothetical protein
VLDETKQKYLNGSSGAVTADPRGHDHADAVDNASLPPKTGSSARHLRYTMLFYRAEGDSLSQQRLKKNE